MRKEKVNGGEVSTAADDLDLEPTELLDRDILEQRVVRQEKGPRVSEFCATSNLGGSDNPTRHGMLTGSQKRRTVEFELRDRSLIVRVTHSVSISTWIWT